MARSLAKSSAIYTFGSVLSRSLGLILIPIYTRVFTTEEYGTLALLNLMHQLLSFIVLMGVSSACMRFYFSAEADDSYRRLLYGNATLISTFGSILVALLLAPIAYTLTGNFLPGIEFNPYIVLVFVVAAFSPLSKLVTGLLRVQNRPVAFILYNLAMLAVQTLLIVLLIWVWNFGVAGQLTAQLIANVLFSIIAVVMLWRHVDFRLSLPETKRLFAFGIPLLPFFIFMWVETASGRFFLEKVGSLSDVGIYALALQIPGLMMMVGTAVDNAIIPYFYATAGQERGPVLLGKLVLRYGTFFGLCALCVIVFGEPAIWILAHERYHEATTYIPFLAVSAWLCVSAKPFVWSMTYRERTGILSALKVASSICMVAALVFFVILWDRGIWGVIIAEITVYALMLGVAALVSHWFYPLVFKGREVVVQLVTLAIAFIFINALQTPSFELWPFLGRVAVLVVTFGIMWRTANLRDLVFGIFKRDKQG